MRQARYTQAAMVGMLAILGIQGFHVFEHALQQYQRRVLHDENGAGVLGSWIDLEPVHFAYNAAFLILIGLVFVQGEFWAKRKALPMAFGLMALLVAFQSWHVVEHIARMAQYIDTGRNNVPGILGNRLAPTGWLHLFYNSFGYFVFVAAFFAGQAHREVRGMFRRVRETSPV